MRLTTTTKKNNIPKWPAWIDLNRLIIVFVIHHQGAKLTNDKRKPFDNDVIVCTFVYPVRMPFQKFKTLFENFDAVDNKMHDDHNSSSSSSRTDSLIIGLVEMANLF